MPVLITSSSGTTGIPKTVMWNQSNAAALLKSSKEMGHPVCGEFSVVAFPLASAGVINLLWFLFGGVRLIFSADMSPVKFVQLLSKYNPASMAAPPAYYEGILALPMLSSLNLSSIRWVFTGMDFLSPSLLYRLREKFNNVSGMGNGYGLIETTNVFMLCMLNGQDKLSGPTNVMKLIEGIGNQIDVRNEHGESLPVGDTGELYIKGNSVVKGYLGNLEETAKSFIDGWFKTGDIVRNEGDNSITLLGRKKYLIKRGGKSVSPIVVQDHINKLPRCKSICGCRCSTSFNPMYAMLPSFHFQLLAK